MNEEEYDEAYAAYEQAVAEAREAAEQAARDEAVDLAHEAAREAVEEARAEDHADLEEHQKTYEEQWSIFYKNYTDEANQKLKEHGISLYCSDIEYAILADIMDEVLGDEYQGGVEVEGTYTGYDELYGQAYAEAYSAALDGLMSDYEEQSFEDFLEEYEYEQPVGEWSTDDFFNHYNYGKGEAVILDDIGKEDEIRNGGQYAEVMCRVKSQIEQSIQQTIAENSLKNGQSARIEYNFKNTYSFLWDVLEIGGATLSGEVDGTFSIDENGSISWEGVLNVHFFDDFKDPWDFFNVVKEDFETGTPFDITGEWVEDINELCE